MEIYLVEDHYDYEGFTVVAAYLDRKAAEKLAEERRNDPNINADDITVETVSVMDAEEE